MYICLFIPYTYTVPRNQMIKLIIIGYKIIIPKYKIVFFYPFISIIEVPAPK